MTKGRILVVEDDADVRETLRDVLEMEGFQVDMAVNGRDALQALEATDAPCLILLDLMMPVMNGWEFLEVIRGREDLDGSIPITVLSAVDFMEAGHYGCRLMGKPPDIDSLIQMANEHCRCHTC